MCYEILNPREWRLSKSGYSIVTGYNEHAGKATDYRIVAEWPGGRKKFEEKSFVKWMEDAEIICNLYNSSLTEVEI